MASAKGFVNKAKSGSRAAPARRAQQAAKARLEHAHASSRRAPARNTAPPVRSKPSTGGIEIERPSAERLTQLGVGEWPIWTKDKSKFSWHYDTSETCYFLEGDVVVTPDGGDPVRVGRGDLVRFPAGMSCTWEVQVPVRKHYSFD